MTTKNHDDLRGKGNIEAVSSVIANWLETSSREPDWFAMGLHRCQLPSCEPNALPADYPA